MDFGVGCCGVVTGMLGDDLRDFVSLQMLEERRGKPLKVYS